MAHQKSENFRFGPFQKNICPPLAYHMFELIMIMKRYDCLIDNLLNIKWAYETTDKCD